MGYTTNCICAMCFKFVGQLHICGISKRQQASDSATWYAVQLSFMVTITTNVTWTRLISYFIIPLTNTYLISYIRALNIAVSSDLFLQGLKELTNEFERFRS
jgi:hypothetical protein